MAVCKVDDSAIKETGRGGETLKEQQSRICILECCSGSRR